MPKRKLEEDGDGEPDIVVPSTQEQMAMLNGNGNGSHSHEEESGSMQPKAKKHKSNKQTRRQKIHEEDDDERESQEMEAGIVEKIRLDNFMCHKSLEVEFCNNVNIITGENGSGKSAIITGLQVALGAKASTTNRGQSQKDLIKTGEDYAVVTVTLRNRGKDAYRPQEYGNSIIIERRIDKNGTGGFKIKNENGKTIANKKEVVQRIMNQFNIHIDNPTTVMTQDVSRKFLAESSATDKYVFFLKATQLQAMLDGLEQTTALNNAFYEIWKQKNESMEEFREELKKKKAEYERAKEMEVMESKIQKLKYELVWANIINLEKELSELKKRHETETKKLEEIEARMASKTGTFEEDERRKTMLSAELTSAAESVSKLSDQIADIQRKIDDYNRKRGASVHQIENLRRSMRDAEKTIERSKKEIADLEKRERVDRSAEEIKRDEQLRELKAQKTTLEEKQAKIVDEKKKVEDELENHKARIGEKEGIISRIQRDKHHAEKDLDSLRSTSGDQYKMLDKNMPRLMELIERNRNRFESLPIGPIGHLIQPRDMKWAQAIETCLFFAKRWFILHNKRDTDVFTELAKAAGVAVGSSDLYGVGIIIQRHSSTPYDLLKPKFKDVLSDQIIVDPKKVSSFPIKYNDFRMLQTSILNTLVDQLSIEKVILVESLDDGLKAMFPNPPHEAKECYTMDGTKLFKRGSSEVTNRPKNFKATFFVADLTDQIEDARNRINHANQQLEQCKKERDAMLSEYNAVQIKLKKYEQEQRPIRNEIISINTKITEIENRPMKHIVDDTEDLIRGLEQKISDRDTYIQDATKRIKDLDNAIQQIDHQINEAKPEIDKLRNEMDEAKSKVETIQQELLELTRKISLSSKEKDTLQNKKNAATESVSRAQRLVVEKEQELETASNLANDIHPERINTTRTPKEISKESTHKQAELERTVKEFRGKQYTDIKQEYITYEKVHQGKEKALESTKENLDVIVAAKGERMRIFQDIREEFQKSVALLFNDYLGTKNHSGTIKFNPSSATLEISVQLNSSRPEKGKAITDLKSLSGGEKSFSTVSFLLSLWELVETPFRVLDEFDIFMDSVHRRIAMDLLIETAKEKHKTKQLIILTPQDVSTIKPDQLLKVIKLRSADRSGMQNAMERFQNG